MVPWDNLRDEEHVQKPVEHGHVDADEENDGLSEEQLEGSKQEGAKALDKRRSGNVFFRDILVISSFFPKFPCSARE